VNAKEAPREVECCPREAAVYLDTTPGALRVFLGREFRRMRTPTVRKDGIRARRSPRRRLRVFIGDAWLMKGRAVAWLRAPAAARRLGVDEAALREELRENQQPTTDGWVSTYGDLPARKLGHCWLLCFEQNASPTTSQPLGKAQ
jgi:hypothetical protein